MVDTDAIVKLSVKNTFVHESDLDEPAARRTSSCPPRHAAAAEKEEDATASSDASSRLPQPYFGDKSWADLSDDSDCDFQHDGDGQRSDCLLGQFKPAPKAEEKKPPAAKEARTPLRSSASMFVPGPSPGAGTPGKVSEPQLPQAATQLGGRTTVMLRNLPCGISRSALIWLLDQQGFAGLYDFVYLPIDFKKDSCLGYAFINLTSVQDANRLTECFDGFSKWPIKCSKVCYTSWSDTQGLDANIERYRNSPLIGDQVPDSYKPAVFVEGKRVAFASPTKPLRPLERRR